MKMSKFAAAAGTLIIASSASQALAQGYLTDSRGTIARDAFNLCWRTIEWTPARAVAECDPDLVPKPAPKPAPALPAPAPVRPVAPAPAPKPAPKPAAAPPKRCDATVTLQSDQLFAFNKADLTSAAKSRLDSDVVARLASCARVDAVVIEGHTDRLGNQKYNQRLSEKRAESVKAYLVSKGTAANVIETIGMGKTVPAKFCPDTKDRKQLIECLAPSRRAVISIKGPGK